MRRIYHWPLFTSLGARTFFNCTPLASSSWSLFLARRIRKISRSELIVRHIFVRNFILYDWVCLVYQSWNLKHLNRCRRASILDAPWYLPSRSALVNLMRHEKKGLVINITSRLEASCLASEKEESPGGSERILAESARRSRERERGSEEGEEIYRRSRAKVHPLVHLARAYLHAVCAEVSRRGRGDPLHWLTIRVMVA